MTLTVIRYKTSIYCWKKMAIQSTRLKRQILNLLKKDEEFRYTVAGLIGLEEILTRLDRHEEHIKQILTRLDRHEEHIKQILTRLDRHEEEIKKLREDMNRGFELMERRLSAIGARWGIMAEEAFREGLRGILEKEMGMKAQRWVAFDEEGKVHGYPSTVEIDIAVKDDKLLLIEITSHAKLSDITAMKRKADLYAEKTGRNPDKVIIVSPYIEENAREAAKTLQIETYTKT
jgi:hypothetical protein